MGSKSYIYIWSMGPKPRDFMYAPNVDLISGNYSKKIEVLVGAEIDWPGIGDSNASDIDDDENSVINI